jgi:hypothetical protein
MKGIKLIGLNGVSSSVSSNLINKKLIVGGMVIRTYNQSIIGRRFRSYIHGPEFTKPNLNKFKLELELEKIQPESKLEKIQPESKLENTDNSYIESSDNLDSISASDWASDDNWEGVSDLSLSKSFDWLKSNFYSFMNKFIKPETTLSSSWEEDVESCNNICNFTSQEMFYGMPYIYILDYVIYLSMVSISLICISLVILLIIDFLCYHLIGFIIKLCCRIKAGIIELSTYIIELSTYIEHAVINNFTYMAMSDNYDTSNSGSKGKITYSGGSGDDGGEDKEKDKKGHYVEGLTLVENLILLKILVDIIRSYRIRLLGGTINIRTINARLAGRILMVASSLTYQYLRAHVDLAEYPILDSYIYDDWNPTLMDGFLFSTYDASEMRQAEEAFGRLDQLSDELERIISEFNSEVSDDSVID